VIIVIKGLTRFYDEKKDTTFYFKEQMLSDKLLITEENMESPDGFDTVIEIKYFNDLDASVFTLYWGDALSPIQVYRIVKDLHDLYEENSLKEFLVVIQELSVQYQSSSMQSEEKNKVEVRKRIIDAFENLQA
jgi:hypothetical protein